MIHVEWDMTILSLTKEQIFAPQKRHLDGLQWNVAHEMALKVSLYLANFKQPEWGYLIPLAPILLVGSEKAGAAKMVGTYYIRMQSLVAICSWIEKLDVFCQFVYQAYHEHWTEQVHSKAILSPFICGFQWDFHFTSF